MKRSYGEKTRCSGQWTEAKFNSFIKNGLRSMSRKWAPIHKVKTKARVARGLYLCNECKQHVEGTVVQVEKGRRKRVNNVFVDHINPIIDPKTGFTTWDDCIENMFAEEEGLQLLCGECHDKKSMEERRITAEYRRERKENGTL